MNYTTRPRITLTYSPNPTVASSYIFSPKDAPVVLPRQVQYLDIFEYLQAAALPDLLGQKSSLRALKSHHLEHLLMPLGSVLCENMQKIWTDGNKQKNKFTYRTHYDPHKPYLFLLSASRFCITEIAVCVLLTVAGLQKTRSSHDLYTQCIYALTGA